MTSKEHSVIMGYFNDKKVSREELEKLLDFENLTMEANTASEISKLLKESPEVESDPQRVIKNFVRFVRERSGSGEITWDELISRMMKAIMEMNSEREIQLPNISPHILRHTACCRFAESGCDIKVLQYLMGQTDIRTTMRVYNHVDVGRVKRELNKLENLSKIKEKPTSVFTPKFTPFSSKSM